MEQIPNQHDYVLTLFEVCQILNKSSRTVSRYVHKNILHPVGVKSRQGTLEYRFSRSEIEEFRIREEQMRHLSFPHLIEMEHNRASFASMSYPAATVKPQAQFAIPGISYPVAPSQSQAMPTTDYPPPARPDVEVPAASNQSFASSSPVDPGSHTENTDFPAMAPDRDNRQIITLLKETTEMLRGQLRVKDDQIKNLDEKIGQLIERNRETNILLKGMQDKMMSLEKPKDERNQVRPDAVMSQSEEVKPATPPTPHSSDPSMPPVRVRVSYSDAVPQVDQNGAGIKESQSNDEEDWDNVPSRNGRQASKGFFGKMFR